MILYYPGGDIIRSSGFFVLTFLRACRLVVKSMTYSSDSWPSTSKASLSYPVGADIH